ncbi:MAG: TadE family protein [Ilumatobacteraceae bacterium]|nr:TadE family protein [Ilumatobacteraceae bacterium]
MHRSVHDPNDRGSASVELVILAPVLMVLMLFVVFVGRAGGAVEQTRHAADAGARAASLVARSSMQGAAASAVNADLRANGVSCADTTVSVAYVSGGRANSVTVTVTCRVNTDGTGLLHVGSRTVSASSTEVIDRYRAG